jgi:hypothetical protein
MATAGGELCFTMSVTDEVELVRDRVARLQRIYPGCSVVLLPDGVEAARRAWPGGRGVSVQASPESLYAATNGGLVVQRHLEAALGSAAAWWFKVDPDTVVWRRFRRLPAGQCFFGTIQGGLPWPSLQGGCIGGTRAAVEALAGSRALLAPELLEPGRSWAGGNEVLLTRARAGLVSFDFVHAWACREAGIPLIPFDEIRSEWRQPPPDPRRYAVTHPHKALDVDAEQRMVRARQNTSARLVELIRNAVPPEATVAVVSKGDEALTALGRRIGRHFPAGENGAWAGFHPRDSRHAIALLESERAAGVDHFALPQTGDWWLEFYDGLARHLATRHRLVAHEPGAGRIWALEEPA